MNPRLAVRESIKCILCNLGMDLDVAERTAEKMHDDPTFLEELESFMQDHIDSFGENYGL